jgi:alpha,alpha-trehalase
VAAAGGYSLLDDTVGLVSERVLDDGPALSPPIVTGDVEPGEGNLDPPLYPDAAVKTGNWVTDQF